MPITPSGSPSPRSGSSTGILVPRSAGKSISCRRRSKLSQPDRRTGISGNQHMNLDLTGKIALVTGSTRGIGLASAAGLAQMGAEVIVNGREAAAVADAIARIKQAAPGDRVSKDRKSTRLNSSHGYISYAVF